jgi:hypothetical protein
VGAIKLDYAEWLFMDDANCVGIMMVFLFVWVLTLGTPALWMGCVLEYGKCKAVPVLN